jgi:hypothetical protein
MAFCDAVYRDWEPVQHMMHDYRGLTASWSAVLSTYSSIAERYRTVERLYCKRPIQCLASSKILTPPPHRPASVYAFGAGGGHTRWVERGRGGGSIFLKTPDTALYSTETVRLKVVDGTFKGILFLNFFSEMVSRWFEFLKSN